MSLVNEQFEFLKDVSKLINKAVEMGFVITGGELHRPPEMQLIYVRTGRSKTMNSNHGKRCAIDLNFFKNGRLTYNLEEIRPIGIFWESLNPKNRWGGHWKNFKDVPHFERNT